MNGVFEAIVHNALEGVIEIDTSRSLFRSSHFLWVFFHRNGLIEALDFRLWFVNLGRVNPNYSSHSSTFDAA